MNTTLWLVVGLGNPGSRYQQSRHNVGFMVADFLCHHAANLSWKASARFEAELTKGRLEEIEVVLIKPQTFMNLSGQSVGPAAHYYRVRAEQIIVIHDDVDLELGRLKVKTGGGDGGHKGVRSIAQHLSSTAFARVRVGIGRPRHGEVTDYVLQRFGPDEQTPLEEQIRQASAATQLILSRGITTAMNQYNTSRATRTEPVTKDNDLDNEKR